VANIQGIAILDSVVPPGLPASTKGMRCAQLVVRGSLKVLLFPASERIVIVGATKPEEVLEAAQYAAHYLSQLFGTRFRVLEAAPKNFVVAIDLGARVSMDCAYEALRSAGLRVVYDPEHHPALQIRLGRATLLLYSTGRGWIAGATSVEDAKRGAETVERILREKGCLRSH